MSDIDAIDDTEDSVDLFLQVRFSRRWIFGNVNLCFQHFPYTKKVGYLWWSVIVGEKIREQNFLHKIKFVAVSITDFMVSVKKEKSFLKRIAVDGIELKNIYRILTVQIRTYFIRRFRRTTVFTIGWSMESLIRIRRLLLIGRINSSVILLWENLRSSVQLFPQL